MSNQHRIVGDVGSGIAVFASWMGSFLHVLTPLLTLIVTLMGIAWYGIQFYNWIKTGNMDEDKK